jgi:hypothetical protein
VSFFAEDSLLFQGFAVQARLFVQFDTDPQAAAANFLHGRTADRAQLLEQVFATFGRPLRSHAPERLIDVQNQAEVEGCGN